MNVRCFGLFLTSLALSAMAAVAQEQDSDKDGLSDFQERHKYLTDPTQSDSDNDGVPDGDWLERREYQYTIRSVVQVMKPVTIDYIKNDDYQDARVLDETETYVELEVIHYPFNTVASTISADENWRKRVANSAELKKWLKPGPTSNWTPALAKEINTALKNDGIDLEKLNDRETAEKVSKWLLQRAQYEDGFSTFITAFDENGKPYIPQELADAHDRKSNLSPEQQWDREILAAQMYKNRARGSCSSSAIYLSGCLRAVGLPARTVLCIPIIDASDENEIEMVRRLKQPAVRQTLLAALRPLKNSWASHTFNEVYIAGRWRRLNYDRLGQNTYDRGLFGLMTHVATFHDWADAKMPLTIGKRQKQRPQDLFGGPNPYSTISLRDQRGKHCKLKLPAAKKDAMIVEKIYWTDSPELPDDIRENCKQRGRFGLIAVVKGFQDRNNVRGFLSAADLRVFLVPKKEQKIELDKEPNRLGIGFDPGCYWLGKDTLHIYVPLGGGDRRDLVEGVIYEFRPRNGNQDFRWKVADGLSIARKSKNQNDH